MAAETPMWISRQILREYLATLSRPQTFSSPRNPVDLEADVARFLSTFLVAEDGPLVTLRLMDLLRTVPVGGKQVHDANIVATMLAHGIPRLLTHNTADFARFGGSIRLEPLISTP